jgi:hypothetical protein
MGARKEQLKRSSREVSMKKAFIIQIAVLFLIFEAIASAQNMSAEVSIGDGRNSFSFAISNHYHAPHSRVVYIRDHYRVHDEELPVVFFLASRVHADPQVIIDLRMRQRMSWLDITFHYGLTPEIYYVPVTRVSPPYGNAYGYYKKHKNNYKSVALVDADVVNLVNLRFMSDYHSVAPELIMDRRGKGEKFVVMNTTFREENMRRGNRNDDGGDGKARKDKNKGNGKGNGRDSG